MNIGVALKNNNKLLTTNAAKSFEKKMKIGKEREKATTFSKITLFRLVLS
jgi:hypothetical protein